MTETLTGPSPDSPRILWILTDTEFPPRHGGAIYSQGLLSALARNGAHVRAMGIGYGRPDAGDSIEWALCDGRRGPLGRAMASRYPAMTARLPLGLLKGELRKHLEEPWDVVVIDRVVGLWALEILQEAREQGRVRQLWYACQNDEPKVWRQAVKLSPLLSVEGIGRRIDLPKVRRAHDRLLRAANLVTTITVDDADAARDRGAHQVLVAPPGIPAPTLTVPAAVHRPRAVLVAGSFLWRMKLRNLEEFLAESHRLITDGIEVLVAGRMNAEDLSRLRSEYPHVQLLGEQKDLSNVYSRARIAVVPEVRGGGLKLKMLDFVYSGITIASTVGATAGIPFIAGDHFIGADDVTSLIERVRENIDDLQSLDRMSAGALHVCKDRFDWDATGARLVGAAAEDTK